MKAEIDVTTMLYSRILSVLLSGKSPSAVQQHYMKKRCESLRARSLKKNRIA